MTGSSIARALDDTADRLDWLVRRALEHASRDGVIHYNEAFGYMKGGLEVIASHIRQDAKSLGGDTDGASLD